MNQFTKMNLIFNNLRETAVYTDFLKHFKNSWLCYTTTCATKNVVILYVHYMDSFNLTFLSIFKLLFTFFCVSWGKITNRLGTT